MQMFNGCTLRVSYKLNHYLENGDTSSNETESYDAKLADYTVKINQITTALTDLNDNNDIDAKKAGKQLIAELNDSFLNQFKGKPDKLIDLKQAISNAIEKLKVDGVLSPEYKPLQDLLDKININFDTIPAVDSSNDVVDLGLTCVKLDGIKNVENEEDKQKFFKGINEKLGGQTESKLGSTIGEVEKLKGIVDSIDKRKVPDDVRNKIEELGTSFDNMLKVIDNNTVGNVRILQDYIFNNLDNDEKKGFKASNNYDETNKQFDGKFGSSTLEGLNKVLGKIRPYLVDVQQKYNSVEDPNKVDKVEPKGDPVEVEKGEKIVVDNLVKIPAGYKVEIDGSQEIKTDNPGEITVKINVKKLDGTEEQISVNVKVVDNTEVSTVQPTLDTTPLTLDNKEHGVMKNSLDIAQKAGLNGAIFYYLENPVDNNEGGETPSNKEYECFMKMKNAPEVYKVKIDRNGNLCPVAEIYNVNDTSSNKRILLENNPSCINYLQAKLQAKIPQDLLGSIKIDWSENKHDYRIVSYGEGKTIEPMTIDGLWVAKKTDPDYLSDCLVLLNFTNYLTRMDGGIDTRKFKNDNPDLKLDDDGKLWVRVKSEKTTDGNGNVLKLGKRYVVPKERFGLDGISQDVLKRFIKYNNGEHWEDNWDKKKENKYYDKVALEGEAQVLGDVTPNPVDGTLDTTINRTLDTTVNRTAVNGNTDVLTTNNTDDFGGISLGEIVVTGKYLRPKNPINFGSESEELLDGKTGKLGGVGAFDGNGNFNFIEEIKENDVDGKKTITINNEIYTGVEYTKGKGLSIQPFTGNGYQRGDSGVVKWFFIGEYNAEEKKGTGKRIFENGAVYDGERKDTLENGRGTYTYPNGDKYEGNFVDGQFNGEGTYTWKNGCSYVGNFESDNMTEGLLTLNTGGKIMSFKVKKDAKGLVITEGDSIGKYIDIKKGTIMDASTSPTETVEVKSYRTILDAVENGKVKNEAIKDDGKGNKYVMIGNEKYFYNIGKPTALSPYINYCIQYEDKVYFGKLDPNNGNKLEGGQFVDKDGKITAVEATSVVNPIENVDVKSLDVNQLNSKLAGALTSISDFKPENISKIKIFKEGEHMTFVNGVHGVNVNIDGLLLDENIFGGAKIEDRMKLLFLASWQFSNRLNKVDQITFQQNDGSEVMLLHNDNSSSYIDYSKFGLDKNTTEKFFNNYNKLISDFKKEIPPEVESSLKKAEELKGKLKDVEVQGKEDGIMMMLMCGKAENFISKFDGSNINEAFNSVSSDCLDLLKNSGGEDVQNIMKEYIKSGETFIQNLSNYITLNGGNDFVRKYNECKTRDDQLALVNSIVDKYNKTRGEVQIFVYSGEKSFWLMNRGLKE